MLKRTNYNQNMEKDMRTCIKDFIKHTEDMEAEEDPDGCGYSREYRLIHEVQLKNRRENVFKSDFGKQEINLKKNRYKDILPYDDHRVKLSIINDDENSDYINASRIMGVKGSGGYIASQGPLAATVNDFWRMIWEFDVEITFMACRTVELAKIKCKQYWHDLGCSDDFGDVNVFTEEEENISSDFTRRTFRVTRGEEVRKVTQYHYSGWPDHGVPSDPAHIRDLIALMRKERLKDKVPLLVHCSAGCGRTGAIIAIDYVWTLLEEGKFTSKFNVYDLICKFREHRMSMVQTADQYALVYKVLKSLCEEWIAKMASHTYVNVEIEDEYVNIGEVTKQEEEHIYEDSVLQEEKPEKSPVSPVSPPTQDRAPEIIPLPMKINEPTKEPSNTDTAVNNIPLVTSEEVPKEVLHKTVIQIGASSSGKQQGAPTLPSGKKGKGILKMMRAKGNKQEVVNLVTSGTPTTTRAATLPRTSGSVSPSMSRSKSLGIGPNDKHPPTSAVSRDRMNSVPSIIPGFPERLPKVKGPIPTPASWKNS